MEPKNPPRLSNLIAFYNSKGYIIRRAGGPAILAMTSPIGNKVITTKAAAITSGKAKAKELGVQFVGAQFKRNLEL